MTDKTPLSITKQQCTNVVRFVDHVIHRDRIDEIKAQMYDLIDDLDTPRVIVSFDGVNEVSSAILGVLIASNKEAMRKGGQLRVCDANSMLQEIFGIMRLDSVLHIDANINQSLDEFNG